MRTRTWAVAGLAVALVALPACGSEQRPAPATNLAGGALPAFRDCADYESRVRNLAEARITEHGWDLADNHSARQLLATDRAGSLAQGGTGAPVEDLGRTAVVGDHVATLWSGELRIVSARDPDPRITATVALPGLGDAGILGLIAVGDRLLVVGNSDPKVHDGGSGPYIPPERRPKADHTVDLTLLDLADPERPRLVGSATIDGRAITSLRTGETIRLAVTTDAEQQLPAGPDPAGIRANLGAASARDLLPGHEIRDGRGRLIASGPLLDCAAIRYPAADSGLDLISVLTIYPDREDPFSAVPAVGVLASGDQVAGSDERMFVVTSPGWNLDDPVQTPGANGRPAVHAFDVTEPGPPRLLGSGTLPGHLPDPRAMSVRGKDLRAVTTNVAPWTVGDRKDREFTVATLETRDARLETAGIRRDLGNGQELKVLRWLDDVVVLAPDSPVQARSFPNQNAAPMQLIELGGRGELALRTDLEPAQRTADFVPLGPGRLLGVGQRTQPDETRGRLDLEVFGVRVDGERADLGEVISFGQGEEQGRFRWLPESQTLLIPGWSTVGSDCAAGTECATAPRPECVGPCGQEPRDEFSGLMGVRVSPDGGVSSTVWIASDLVPVEVVAVAGRLAVVGTSGVILLDAERLTPLGSVTYPEYRPIRAKK